MIAGAIIRRCGSVGMIRWTQRADGSILFIGKDGAVPDVSDISYLLWRSKIRVPYAAELRSRLYHTAEGLVYEPECMDRKDPIKCRL